MHLLSLINATELLNNVKTENMLLLEKVKNLEHKLSVAREQTNRSASSKLDRMLSVQKSPSNKTGLGFVESINVFAPISINCILSSSSEPPVSEVMSEAVKPIEVTPPRKIRVDLKELKPKKTTLSKDKSHDKPA